MNFLQLCQELRTLAPGIGGQAGQPTSVTGQTGDMANVVAWIRNSWTEIQAKNPHWLFMRAEFSGTASTADVEPSVLGITDLSDWHTDTLRLYPVSEGATGDTFLDEWAHQDLLDTYRFGVQQPSKPVCFAVRPRDKALELGPTPSEAVVIRGEYQRAPQILASNTDTPTGLPSQLHMLIVYWAMTKHAGYEAAPEIMADALNQRESLMSRLEQDWLPRLGYSGAFA